MKNSSVNLEIKSSRIRWLILLFLGLLLLIISFNHTRHEIIDYVPIENTTLQEAAWLLTPRKTITNLIVSPLLAWMIFKKFVAFKVIFIAVSLLLLFEYIILFISFIKPGINILSTLEQIFGGISKSMAISIAPAFAIMWFPETQIGLTIGLADVGVSLGSLGAYINLPNSTQPPGNIATRTNMNISLNLHRWFYVNSSGNQYYFNNKQQFGIISFIFAVLTLVILVLSCFIVMDLPQHPPSKSQERERRRAEISEDSNCSKFAQETKHLISNFVFIFYGIAYAFAFYSVFLEDITLRLLLATKTDLSTIGNFLMTIFSLSSIIGSVTSGMLLDRFKRYTSQAAIGAAFSFVFSLLVLLGCYSNNILSLCVGVSLYGFSTRLSLIALVDSILQHTHPINPLFLVNWLSFFRSIDVILLNLIKRIIFSFWGIPALLVLHSSIMFVTIILSLIVRPDLNRLKIETKEVKSTRFSEKDFLIRH